MTPAVAGHPGLVLLGLGLAAAAFWGSSDFLGGLATRRAHVVLVVAVAHTMSLGLLLPFAVATHSPIPAHGYLLLGLGAGLCGAVALLLYYQALSLGEMGITTALTGLLTALIPVAYSFLTLGAPKATQIAGFVIAAAAIALIAYDPTGKARPLALGLATLAGICFGAFLIVLQLGRVPGIVWQLIASRVASASVALALLLWIVVRKSRHTLLKSSGSGRFLWLAGSAGVLEATGSLLYMGAARAGRLDVAAILASLYPAVTILLAGWVLKEKTSALQTLGMALALIAVAMVSI